MAKNTVNYNLIKPDYQDTVDVAILNNNFDTIDAALKTVETKASLGGGHVVVDSLPEVQEAADNVVYFIRRSGNVDDSGNSGIIVSGDYLPITGGTLTGDLAVEGSITANGDITSAGNITAARVYNAVYNDYAEFFPRGEETEAGDIIALDVTSAEERYIKAVVGMPVVGVHSEEFAQIIGGKPVVSGVDYVEENLKSYIPVAVAGRVWVNVINAAEANLGDFVVPSDVAGKGICVKEKADNSVGIVVSAKGNGKVKIKVF